MSARRVADGAECRSEYRAARLSSGVTAAAGTLSQGSGTCMRK